MYQNKKTSFIYYILIFIIILNISQASIINEPLIPFFIGILLFIVHFFTRKTYDKIFITIVIIWLIICLLSSIVLTGNILILRIVNYTVFLLFTPYLLIKLLGKNFWVIFEKIIFILTLISIPLYILNALFLTEFNNLWHVFRHITGESFGISYPYWSSFIYVNAIYDPSFNLIRNCGFMWEPGSFSLMIILAIIYNLRNNGSKFSGKVIIYIIALATTFSTAGYLSIVFIILSIYLKKLSIPNIIMISVLLAFYFLYVYKLEFVSEKIDSYISGYQDNKLVFDEDGGYIKVNRLRGAYYAVQETLKFPTGYGVVKKSDISESEIVIYGTNGLGSLLILWGFPMFIYLLILARKYINVIGTDKINIFNANLLFVALMIMFFSNPISQNLITYFIFFTPIVYKKLPVIKGPPNMPVAQKHMNSSNSYEVKT